MENIIGICGGSASGKSTFARKIAAELDDCSIISLDSFYRNDLHANYNFDYPAALDIELMRVFFADLSMGKMLKMPYYNFKKHQRDGFHEIMIGKNIVVEGLFVLHFDFIREKLTKSYFVDAPDDQRLIRRIRRDTKKRGRSLESVLKQWEEQVQPMYLKYVEPCKNLADQIIEN
ncbi:AAA family ATPase [Candidatus Peregrinibacteria bacterium]|nr:AAA family ATPase [Candidatus Peregrinibacteria bacterium]